MVAARLCGMFSLEGNCNNTMKYIRIFAALTVLAFTLTPLLLVFNTSQAYAQNNTIPGGNQSSSSSNIANDTAPWSNQSDSGSISGYSRGV
ncbi:MAG: hypothetical protein WA461_08525 [Nitrososphaeraceae archaeon]